MNISEKIYIELKQRIIGNSLRGAISEVELCRELGASRTPLREALFRLVAEGWVVQDPRTNYKAIKAITLSEIKDIFAIRKDVELIVLRASWERQDPAAYAAIADAIQHAMTAQDIDALLDNDDRLHEQLLRDCRNEMLTRMLSYIYERLRMLRHDDRKNSSILDSSREHLDICAAIVARDYERAQAAIAAHVERSHGRIMGVFA